MGMCLALRTLGDENIRKVLADPPLIWKVIAPDDPQMYEQSRTERRPGLVAKLFGKQKQPDRHSGLTLAEGEVAETDLDKAWHGIHYMLTQTAWEGEEPLNFLVGGGTTVGDVDVGYGPARAFASDEVNAISSALRPIDSQFLRKRFDPEQMMKLEIYPTIWDRDPADDDTFGYCAEYFASLKTFIEEAAKRNVGLIVYIT
jgi:hypothetical protein